MTENPLRVAIIIASTREGRFAPTVGTWFAGVAAERDDMTLEVLDVADTPPPSAFGAAAPGRFGEVSAKLAEADAYVVVTCEYNHSFPGTLKNLIDTHFYEWRAKPVAFVSYGGLAGGLRSVEHLRGVFAELHAVTIRDTVSFHHPWNWFGDDGRPSDAEGAAHAAKGLLDQLDWWGQALRAARSVRPYES
ncbi:MULTISPECIES: NADPH-dependent FMN reductase [Actinomadura]|uniref:NADPH-dependent FMN reductase n=1 Tax=Actinomadura litoris TaxID=2678616 RepID=A0A7K1L9S0_9ACTN|nr:MULTISPECIES: NAD(P)H-dependent oxidoreductase [Actinomadura]MBT2207142.1 NAD(P)H-dependent oxidoreductase [Actinomadura sp. NEAU-AAG7]MUN41171.1 NADPH-dependent FMN reductase [Actinomadura litoris]